mgnify:CR=1 FL=1
MTGVQTCALPIWFDAWFETHWVQEEITPAAPADVSAVLRRLSLALHGTIPSLEEFKEFEADTGELRLERWTQRLLDDGRYGAYFSERLGRVLVGTAKGHFLAFRRDRFVAWLSEPLAADRPWDQLVTELVSATWLPSVAPPINFVPTSIPNPA